MPYWCPLISSWLHWWTDILQHWSFLVKIKEPSRLESCQGGGGKVSYSCCLQWHPVLHKNQPSHRRAWSLSQPAGTHWSVKHFFILLTPGTSKANHLLKWLLLLFCQVIILPTARAPQRVYFAVSFILLCFILEAFCNAISSLWFCHKGREVILPDESVTDGRLSHQAGVQPNPAL